MILRYVLEYGLSVWAGNSGCIINWEGGPSSTVANRKYVRACRAHWGGKGYQQLSRLFTLIGVEACNLYMLLLMPEV